jgi:hypothetical protein
MSYPRLESGPAPSPQTFAPSQTLSPTQAEIDAASPQRAMDALHRALARLTRAVGRDWQHCGKATCLRSRRCRGFACEPEVEGDERES